MLTLEVWLLLAVLWVAGCGLVLWLAWRAARRDDAGQREAEAEGTPENPAGQRDRAA